MTKKKGKKGILVTVIAMTVIVAILVFAFIQGGWGSDSETDSTKEGEVQKLLARNLDSDYPATPREVVKLYSRVMKCLIDENVSEEDFTKMSDLLRELYDEELLAVNPKKENEASLKQEIEGYSDNKAQITNYVIQNGSSLVQEKVNGQNYVTVQASYLMWDTDGYKKTYEQFRLREDTDNKWKILGWEQIDPVTIDPGED